MSWWNLGGMNPQYKDFVDKHPDKTMIGMMWAFYWRLAVFFIMIEFVIIMLFFFIGLISGLSSGR